MKKLLVILLALALVFAFAACGQEPAADDNAEESAEEAAENTETSIDYPTQNISFIIPWNAGGATDLLARLLADQLSDSLGVSVICENKTGGGGAIGHNAGSSADPDGYTITIATTEASISHLLGLADYSWEDFKPVCLLATGPSALAVPADSEFNTLDDLLKYAKDNPGSLMMSAQASGGIWNLCANALLNASGAEIDLVPYDGGAESITALLGGYVDCVSAAFSEILPYVQSGDLKMLAVSADERCEAYPDAPTYKELGYDISMGAWWGIMVPKDTPDEIVALLYEQIAAAMDSDDLVAFLDERGYTKDVRDPAGFLDYLSEKDAFFTDLISNIEL